MKIEKLRKNKWEVLCPSFLHLLFARYLVALLPPTASRPETACIALETIAFSIWVLIVFKEFQIYIFGKCYFIDKGKMQSTRGIVPHGMAILKLKTKAQKLPYTNAMPKYIRKCQRRG